MYDSGEWGGGKDRSTVRSLMHDRGLGFECARVLHESLLQYILIYGSEKRVCREKKGSNIRVVQTDNLRSLLAIRIIYRIP